MAKANKKVINKKDEDTTLIYMVVGFCVGVIVTFFMFDFYWIGVGGGVGMIIGVTASIISDYIVTKENKNMKTAVKKNTKKKSKH